MKLSIRHLLLLSCLLAGWLYGPSVEAKSGKSVEAPKPCDVVPSARQLAWHDLGFYAFIHFTTTTYRDLEWGYGDASPDEFAPDRLDCRQWMNILKAAGMKGVIFTAKHHDGFCLWPSRFTDYSVRSSSWMNGQGDVVGMAAREARKAGLKFGVYLSPWDRHDMRYGTPAYVAYYRDQLRELLTQYGPIFEVWQDGANGGDGYYGGLREKRTIDSRTYYDWATTDSMIRQLQPSACIFSDAGPDARWCGTEKGFVGEPNWATLHRGNYAPGKAKTEGLQHGEKDGAYWVPAEVDVSIRPGWFYHQKEDTRVKTVDELMTIYYNSVGRGANLILNVPPTRSGLIHPIDSQRLHDFGRALRKEFSRPLPRSLVKEVFASNERGGRASRFTARNVVDGKKLTYWATDDSVSQATLTLTLRSPQQLHCIRLREPIALGQRIDTFTVEGLTSAGRWVLLDSGSTIGPQRLLRMADEPVSQVRVTVGSSLACPLLSEVACFLPPKEG